MGEEERRVISLFCWLSKQKGEKRNQWELERRASCLSDIPVFGRQLVFGAQQVSWRSLGAPAGLAAKLPSSKGR